MWLCHRACGVLVPQPGIEPGPMAVKACVLTSDHQGIPFNIFCLDEMIHECKRTKGLWKSECGPVFMYSPYLISQSYCPQQAMLLTCTLISICIFLKIYIVALCNVFFIYMILYCSVSCNFH